MNNEYLDKLPNDKFTIEASRAVSDARFKIREVCTKAEAQNFIKDTLEKEVNGIDIIEFEDNNHDICLTMNNNIPDNEKLDYTVYYIVNRLFDQYVKKYIKGISISQLYSIVYIGNHIYIYLSKYIPVTKELQGYIFYLILLSTPSRYSAFTSLS